MLNPTGQNIPARNFHHIAYRCRDAEQTRWFYEELLGLPMAATILYRDGLDECNTRSPFLHLFFALDDGSFLAFFDDPCHANEEDFKIKHGFDIHLAFEVESEEALRDRQKVLEDAGIETLYLDHVFLRSVYAFDPNGIEIEFTWRTDQYDAIVAEAKGQVEADMQAWKEISQSIKAERFDQAALTKRGPIPFDQPVLDQ